MARRYSLNKTTPTQGAISGIQYDQELNTEQLAAVTSPPGPVLVIAGAGSGKTRTLTYRVAWLLDQGVQPWNILLLTFTNKAAKEMTARVNDLISMDLSALWSGTFHSIANRILRRHAELLGFTHSFTILDSDDRKGMIKEIIKSLGLHERSVKFPKPEVVSSLFSLADNKREYLEEALDDNYPYLHRFLDQITQIHQLFIQKKQQNNSMDFDDLLTNVVKLLKDHPDVRQLYSKRFQHILVDEYQDTNSLQSEFIELLSEEYHHLMVVGDDAQSIYSWRGADMEHILQFTTRYPQAQTFKIETNYRSVPEILELSNAAIAPNEWQIEKNLRSSRPASQMSPALVPLNDSRTQAIFITQRIRELLDEGMESSEIAVLYRAHFHSMELQMELTRSNIPFKITSGVRFFEQAHIKDIISFIRFACNRQDELAFLRIVQLLEGIGPVAAQKLWQQWLNTEASRSIDPPASFSAILLDFKIPTKARDAWAQLAYTLDELAPEGKLTNPANMLVSINEAIYDEYMQTEFDNYDQRQQDLLYLAAFSERFDSVEEFLSQLSLLGNADDENPSDQTKNDSVTLSTIHQAKGLEWKVVFLIGLCDGMFPHQRTIDEGDQAGLEEERRLFYVGTTRAKDQLYLTYPRWNFQRGVNNPMQTPSRFLEDIPDKLIEEWIVD